MEVILTYSSISLIIYIFTTHIERYVFIVAEVEVMKDAFWALNFVDLQNLRLKVSMLVRYVFAICMFVHVSVCLCQNNGHE